MKNTKRIIAIVLAALALFALASCGKTAKTYSFDIGALASKLNSEGEFVDPLEKVDASVVSALYGFSDAKNVVVYAGSGATPEEIIVAEYENEDAAKKGLETMNTRLSSQKKTFDDYNKEYRPLLDKPIVKQLGKYTVYCVSSNYDKSLSTLNAFVGD